MKVFFEHSYNSITHFTFSFCNVISAFLPLRSKIYIPLLWLYLAEVRLYDFWVYVTNNDTTSDRFPWIPALVIQLLCSEEAQELLEMCTQGTKTSWTTALAEHQCASDADGPPGTWILQFQVKLPLLTLRRVMCTIAVKPAITAYSWAN